MPTFFDRSIAFAVGILLVNFIAWRFLRTGVGRARLATRAVLFLILSIGMWSVGANPLYPAPWVDDPPRHMLFQALELLWWLQGAEVAAVVFGVVVLPSTLRRERLFQDVLRAAIYLGACVFAVAHVLAVSVGGLVATSGALAIILGLAVQSTLSDVFSGIVLNATQPFAIGDDVSIGSMQGKVVDSDWRATTLVNSQGNYVVVPNSTAAKQSIVNESRPPLVHGITVTVRVAERVRPAVIITALRDAIEGTVGLLAQPAPTARATRIDRLFVEYEVVTYVASAGEKDVRRNDLIDEVYRHLIVRGVAVGRRDNDMPSMPGERLLRSVPMFQTLTNEQIAALAKTLDYKQYAPGELVHQVKAGGTDDVLSLYIVASGVAVVLVDRNGTEVELRRLVPGDAVGQSGILTGVSIPIKVRAIGKVVMVVLNKDALTPVLHDRPEVGQSMLDALLEYQSSVSERENEIPPEPPEQGKSMVQWLLDGMRRVHSLL